MNHHSLHYKLRGIFLPLFLIVLDQITKYLAVRELKGKESRPLISGLLGFTYVENRGMSFGLLQGQRVLFLVLTVLICAVLVYIYLKIPEMKRFRARACSGTCVVLLWPS